MDTREAYANLEKERSRLESEMGRIGRPSAAIPGEWEPLPNEAGSEPDILDQAEIVTSREDDAAVLADLEARYASVLDALARIESGTYGVCEVCGASIEKERLAADPAATTCKQHR
jgi:DnaK suppressor protein